MTKTKRKGTYKYPRRFSKKYCLSKPCNKMGFTEKASCRPYKNCYHKINNKQYLLESRYIH